MEKGEEKSITTSFQKLQLSPNSKTKPSVIPPSLQYSRSPIEKKKPPSLESLCLGVVGKHFEDIIEDLGAIAVNIPADTKMAMAAIARRRRLLNDDVIISLAESSWEILDISGSDVSDFGLARVAERCKALRAIDIRFKLLANGIPLLSNSSKSSSLLLQMLCSRCSKITAAGVSELVWHCHSLETLRFGGCPRSDHTARRCLGIFKPKLNDIEGESWEELDPTEIAHGAESLRWLVWPKIDDDSLESFAAECPRIIVNPKPSPFGFRGVKVPAEALPNIALDDPIVKGIDPRTWAVSGFTARPTATGPSNPSSTELPIAEKFRLAFAERDSRLAPKRAKNARQHLRRAKKELVMTSTSAKAFALASQASKSLHGWN